MISELEDNEATTENPLALAHSPASASLPVPATQRAFSVPGDECNRATEALPPEQRDMIRWLHAYAWNNNIRLDDLGLMLKRGDGKSYDGNTVYKIFKGLHQAKLDSFCSAVSSFRKVIEERASILRAPFVMTRLGKRIFKICESAKLYQTIEFVFGDSQIGKTTNLEEFARQNNHGMTVYWRLPAGGGLRRSVEELAIACRLSTQQKTQEILRRVVRFFTPEMLLIVDEAHQMFISPSKQGKIETAELIREIHDRGRCGVVISATKVLQREIQEGRSKELLRQLDLRSLGSNVLPDRPDAKDLEAFAAHYGLPPANTDPEALKLQNAVVQYEGLGRWLKRLMAASRLSNKQGAAMTWQHVIRADNAIRRKAQATLD